MRFVFVSETPDRIRGGIERHAAEMVAELGRRGHRAAVVRPGELERSHLTGADWLVFDGVRRSAIVRHARRRPGGPRLALFPHGSFLEEARHAELRAARAWRPTLRYLGRRGFDATWGRWAFGRFDRWFALSDGEAADLHAFLGVPWDRVQVDGPFVTAEFLAAADAAPLESPIRGPYLCSVARIDRRKNFVALLEALDGAPYRLALAGQDRGGLVDLEAAAARIPGARWEYLGTVTEAQKVALIRHSDGVVIPSVAEGVPALALEARALGRPVVLAGVAYGPVGPGVVRCDPNAASLRSAIVSLSTRPLPPAVDPPKVKEAVDRFLRALDTPGEGYAVPDAASVA